MSKQVKILKKDLQHLYWDERKSSIEIAKIYHCHPMTIRNRIRELSIINRTPSDARMHYEKCDFSENATERAYLLGFRLGDLSAYKTSVRSELIVVRCHTTQMVQVTLIQSLFSPYGHVTISKGVHGYTVNCYLNTTFIFLLPKHETVPEIVNKQQSSVWAFMAGYIDAEGSFGINQGRARFKIDSYDVHVLEWMTNIFRELSILIKFRQIASKGQSQYHVGIFHKDLWRLEINEGNSIFHFITLIGKYIRHEKRKTDMMMCLNNIKERKNKRTIL